MEIPTERLSAFMDGEADSAERAGLRQRLAKDGDARQRPAALLAGDDAVRAQFDALAHESEPPPARLRAVIADGFAQRRATRRRRAALRWTGVAAAAAAGLALGFVFLDRWVEQRALELAEAERARLVTLLRQTVQEALEGAESGQRIVEAGSAAAVSITPTRTYRSASKHWCREFEEQLVEDGRETTRKGLACRGDDGVWRRVRTTIDGEITL